MLEHYLSLATKAIFVENMALAFFLGMCSFLAVSRKVETAAGLGAAVIFVLAVTTPLNQILYKAILEEGALTWIPGGRISICPFSLSWSSSAPLPRWSRSWKWRWISSRPLSTDPWESFCP